MGFGEPAERRVAVVIEDDLDIRYLLEQVLMQAGFETVTTGNGEDGVRAVEAHDPVVTTLDVSLPGIDGYEVARRIRSSSRTYIVMISALGEEIDVLQGLEAGADDYLVKPFRPRELRARLAAMLRRPRDVEPRAAGGDVERARAAETAPSTVDGAVVPERAVESVPVHAVPDDEAPVLRETTTGPGPDAGAAQHSDPGWVSHNGLRVHPDARLARVDEQPVDLTKSEFDLIATLLESRRRVRSKADLALALRDDAYVTTHFVGDADRRNVEVHMANLRRKLGDDPNAPRFVVTVRGVGYRLTGPGDPGFTG